MDKITKAISDTKSEIQKLGINKIEINAKLHALEIQLESLISIQNDESIPHFEKNEKIEQMEIQSGIKIGVGGVGTTTNNIPVCNNFMPNGLDTSGVICLNCGHVKFVHHKFGHLQ